MGEKSIIGVIGVLEEKKNWGGASIFIAELKLNVWLPWWLKSLD